jgi:hypothetical protein
LHWLPPWLSWEPWAKEGLEIAEKGMASKMTSVLEAKTLEDFDGTA